MGNFGQFLTVICRRHNNVGALASVLGYNLLCFYFVMGLFQHFIAKSGLRIYFCSYPVCMNIFCKNQTAFLVIAVKIFDVAHSS